jgi:hypothetical protein
MQPVPSYDAVTIPYLSMVLGGMPVMGVRSYLRLKSGKPLPPKSRRYRGMIALQIVLLGYSLVVAQQNRVDLLGRVPGIWTWLAAAVYLTWIAFRLHRAWKKLNAQRKQRARILLPENPGELRYWVPISLLAGLSEECAFRGMGICRVARDQRVSGTGDDGVCLGIRGGAHDARLARYARNGRDRADPARNCLPNAGPVVSHRSSRAVRPYCGHHIVGTIAMRHFMRDDQLLVNEAQPISAGG